MATVFSTDDNDNRERRMPKGSEKKKTGNGRAHLYVDIDDDVKVRLDILSAATRRKLNVEVQIAIEKHLADEEPKYGLPIKIARQPEEPTAPPRRSRKKGD